jgi:hypothetical protein
MQNAKTDKKVMERQQSDITLLKNQNADLYQSLQDERNLSEERRVALEKCEPYTHMKHIRDAQCCVFCESYDYYKHETDCEYLKMIKQD